MADDRQSLSVCGARTDVSAPSELNFSPYPGRVRPRGEDGSRMDISRQPADTQAHRDVETCAHGRGWSGWRRCGLDRATRNKSSSPVPGLCRCSSLCLAPYTLASLNNLIRKKTKTTDSAVSISLEFIGPNGATPLALDSGELPLLPRVVPARHAGRVADTSCPTRLLLQRSTLRR
jgi:hypothetical protein